MDKALFEGGFKDRAKVGRVSATPCLFLKDQA